MSHGLGTVHAMGTWSCNDKSTAVGARARSKEGVEQVWLAGDGASRLGEVAAAASPATAAAQVVPLLLLLLLLLFGRLLSPWRRLPPARGAPCLPPGEAKETTAPPAPRSAFR